MDKSLLESSIKEAFPSYKLIRVNEGILRVTNQTSTIYLEYDDKKDTIIVFSNKATNLRSVEPLFYFIIAYGVMHSVRIIFNSALRKYLRSIGINYA